MRSEKDQMEDDTKFRSMWKIIERNTFTGYFDVLTIKLIDCKNPPPRLTEAERELLDE